MEREGLLGNVREFEGHFGEEFRRMASEHPIVKEMRGMGFFWAVEVEARVGRRHALEATSTGSASRAWSPGSSLEGGLICRFEDKDDPVIEFSPALVSDREVLGRIAEITGGALTELEKELGYRS